ncbi:MAG: 23S rRNA pseudouridine(1911/1915/1917) synthase RluD [Pseudomonadales bacterium]|nr:23S rRNA pseudouridine(1911/1915/1917) synthase RluD [Pseudomonadales bacterium]MCP5213600.1 23S rRNA pseudouridine(1911/1915/1917) synthase RluD [Pseudomonadales bacterium]
MENIALTREVPTSLSGVRLDQGAAQLFPDFSRSRLQGWIKSGQLRVDGEQKAPKAKLLGGELLEVNAVVEENEAWEPQAIGMDIVYEDEDILVINKPAGLVVHPAAGHADGTLLNAILHHAPSVAALPRAGIVHRLDKDTTGLMVVAKTLRAHKCLVEQLQDRSMGREYEAVVLGVMTGGGTVDEPIGRHGTQRIKMSVSHSGKPAITNYTIIKRFREHTHLRIKLETGRTHQIRVHMAHIRYPIVGDPLYGGRLRLPKAAQPELVDLLREFKRQALHAKKLALIHPASEELLQWECELPQDMQQLLQLLKADTEAFNQDVY